MQTLAFVTDKFYFEFVINSEEDIAYVTKRAFQDCDFHFPSQSTSMPIDCARKYYATLLTKWSVQAGPGVQTPWHFLPPAEMGTAQQELPVAKLETTHTLQLTTEELSLLHTALKDYRWSQNKSEEEEEFLSSVRPIMDALEDTLRAPLSFEIESRRLEKSVERWKQKCNRAKSKLQNLESPMIDTREILTLLHWSV